MRLVPILVVALATALLVTAYAPVAFAEPETTRPSESAEQRDSQSAEQQVVPDPTPWGDSRSVWRWAVQGEWKLLGPKSIHDARTMVDFVDWVGDPSANRMSWEGLSAEQSARVLEWRRLESIGVPSHDYTDMKRLVDASPPRTGDGVNICLSTLALTYSGNGGVRTAGGEYKVLSMDENQLVLRVIDEEGQTLDLTVTIPLPGRLTLSAPSWREPLVFREVKGSAVCSQVDPTGQ